MDLRQQYNIATDATFNERVAMGLYTIAREVLGEPVDFPNHALRVRFAQSIMMAEVTTFKKYAAMMVADPDAANLNITSAAVISDSMILGAVRKIWNTLSGVV